jgi:phosphate starvation-inducible protein PhoH
MLHSSLKIEEYFDAPIVKPLTKKEKRRLKLLTNNKPVSSGLKLKYIEPKTENQHRAFEAHYKEKKNLLMIGAAGTGKSFLSLYFALDDILHEKSNIKNVLIYRSAVQTREIGFLGGKLKEKIKVFSIPYQQICTNLFKRSDAYDILENKQIIFFESTSFIRGITLENSYVIIDEAQNMNQHELHSLITRIGENCKIMLCGDISQDDLKQKKEKSGLADFITICNHMNCFETVEFTSDDICRSGFVKDYYKAREALEKEGKIAKLLS